MYRVLGERIERLGPPAGVETYNSTFTEAAPRLPEPRPDSIIYINVLEHIADDALELKLIRETLADGGRVFIFVPALP